MAATLQEVDLVYFVDIVGNVEVFGVQVVAMRYIDADILLYGYLMLFQYKMQEVDVDVLEVFAVPVEVYVACSVSEIRDVEDL